MMRLFTSFMALIALVQPSSAFSPLFQTPSRTVPSIFQGPTSLAKQPFTQKNTYYNKRYTFPTTSTPKSTRFSQFSEDSELDADPIIENASVSLRRINWFSWWSQVILTVVSSITLLFAKSVLKVGTPEGGKQLVSGGFLFAGSGISLSFLSIIWTWGGTRLSRRLKKRNADYSRIKVANMIRRTITIGTGLNLAGMFVTLIGAQQIVGLLASKLLSMQGVTPFGMSAAAVSVQTLQPLDILIVQANTNTLLSHFISLAASLIMTRSVKQLDPPSMEDDPR